MEHELDSHRLAEIGKHLKGLRIKAGYSSYETFANEYNIARKQYWRLESGEGFNITTLFKLLNIHEISLSEFFKDMK